MEQPAWTRRGFLKSLAAAGAVATAPTVAIWPRSALAADPITVNGAEWDPAPFTLGVASGYPTTDSVILWTRLAPDPLLGDGGIQSPTLVQWVVGDDPTAVAAALGGGGGTGVVASGSATAVAASGHSVHVEVTGLDPGQTYWYGFAALGQTSVIGRTRTSAAGPTEQMKFAVASCQFFSREYGGFFGAHRHIAEEDVDFVLFLGDYIYEGQHGTAADRGVSGWPNIAVTVEDFRIRYAVYKGDPHLREAHRMHPWILTWDDHEVQNNYAGTTVSSSLRANGYQAYYEHQPIRLTAAGPPSGPSFRIYQQATFGDLLDLAVLDTRQYRIPWSGSGNKLTDPANSMLGADQKAWLKDLLSASTTAWRVIGTSVLLGGNGFTNADSWDGYQYERHELLQYLVDTEIPDVVSLGGDTHRHMWSHAHLDFDDAASPVVLAEFGTTSISSSNGGLAGLDHAAMYVNSTALRYYDTATYGYMVCDVTKDRWRTTAWAIQNSESSTADARHDPNATKYLRTVFEVDRGSPLMRHVEGEEGSFLADSPTPALEDPPPAVPELPSLALGPAVGLGLAAAMLGRRRREA